MNLRALSNAEIAKIVCCMSVQQRADVLRRGAVRCAQHIARRVELFRKYLLLNKHVWGGYEIADYWIRTEFQNRGTPHIHCLFWFKHDDNMSNIDLSRLTFSALQNVKSVWRQLVNAQVVEKGSAVDEEILTYKQDTLETYST